MNHLMTRALAALLSLAPLLASAACTAPPLGDTTLYLRGGLNNWSADDDYAFQFRCDAYFLNLSADRPQEFKIADEAWTPATTWGANAQGRPAQGAAAVGNLRGDFHGEHTLKLSFDAQGRPSLDIGPRSFKPAPSAAALDPITQAVRFDSRAARHKQPFGAVTAGSTVDFALQGPANLSDATLVIARRTLTGNQEQLDYTELARVPLKRERGQWRASWRFEQPAVYGYLFEFRHGGKTWVLQNNRDPVYWTREKGSMGAGLVEPRPAAASRLRWYRQTVYAADFQVPAWARDTVYYYVFPERFRNGDPSNDPRPGGGRPQDRYQNHDVEHHARWNERPYRPAASGEKGDGSDAIYNNDFFGGDLAGLIEKLDYIRSLGANAIYMTPVFRAASNHKYDTADYKTIDPAFGSNADFERLCAEAAKRGIRVIPDTSLNHVGSDSPYFNRFNNYPAGGAFDGGRPNPASPYASWFKFKAGETEPDKQYQGWVGVADLPELDKNSPAFRAFAYGDADSVTRLWLQRGAAGWRMDVAPWVPDDFWREWRRVVKATRPDALTIAETWFDASKFFLGDEFDSTMNYIFRNAVLDYAKGLSARKAYASLELIREAYPPQAFFALMNLLSTHDQPRALHHFGADDHSSAQDLALAKQRLRLALLFQMSYPGSPTVYYGDEVGLGGGEDPDNRRPYPWADQGGQPDEALLGDFKRLIALRQQLPVLRHGQLLAPLLVDEHVIVLARRDGDTWAVIALNNSAQARRVQLTLPFSAPRLRDALGGEPLSPRQRRLTLDVPPLFGRVLVTP